MRITLLLVMMQIVVHWTASAQTKVPSKDSIDIKTQIEGFYSWYIGIGRDRKLNKDFNPSFIKKDDGMTTLDFTKYKDGLRRYKFSENFIQRKISDYKSCIDNLNKIPFDKFSQFTELDDFEEINCNFGNRYEWTGGMEPKDRAELVSLKSIDKSTIVAQLDFISYGRSDGTVNVTLRKHKKEWFVDNLQLN